MMRRTAATLTRRASGTAAPRFRRAAAARTGATEAREAAAATSSPKFFTFRQLDDKTIVAARAKVEESVDAVRREGYTPVTAAIQKTNETYSVRSGHSLNEAAATMLAKKVASLLVRDEGGRVVGLITERDFLKTNLAELSGEEPVDRVMTPRAKLVMASPNATLRECLELMLAGNFRHLPIYERGNERGSRVIGVVSIRALVRQIFLEQEKELSDLRSFIADSYSA